MPYNRTGRPPGRPEKSAFLPDGTPNLTDRQWFGAASEPTWIEGGGRARPADDPWPANASAVARRVGTSERAVQKWRRNPVYRVVVDAFHRWTARDEISRLGRIVNGYYRLDATERERIADIAADARRLFAVAEKRRRKAEAQGTIWWTR